MPLEVIGDLFCGWQFLVGSLFLVAAVLAVFVAGIIIGRIRGGLPKGPGFVKNTTPLGRLSAHSLVVDDLLVPNDAA